MKSLNLAIVSFSLCFVFFIELRNFYRWIWRAECLAWTSILVSSKFVPSLSFLKVNKLARKESYSYLAWRSFSSSIFYFLCLPFGFSKLSWSEFWLLSWLYLSWTFSWALASALLVGDKERLRLLYLLFLDIFDNSCSKASFDIPLFWAYCISYPAKLSMFVFSPSSSFLSCTFFNFLSKFSLAASVASFFLRSYSNCYSEIISFGLTPSFSARVSCWDLIPALLGLGFWGIAPSSLSSSLANDRTFDFLFALNDGLLFVWTSYLFSVSYWAFYRALGIMSSNGLWMTMAFRICGNGSHIGLSPCFGSVSTSLIFIRLKIVSPYIFPKIVCFLSSHGQASVVIKNCDSF